MGLQIVSIVGLSRIGKIWPTSSRHFFPDSVPAMVFGNVLIMEILIGEAGEVDSKTDLNVFTLRAHKPLS